MTLDHEPVTWGHIDKGLSHLHGAFRLPDLHKTVLVSIGVGLAGMPLGSESPTAPKTSEIPNLVSYPSSKGLGIV